MKHILTFFAILTLTFSLAGCQNNGSTTGTSGTPEIKENAKPVADAEYAVIEMENAAAYGTIKLELYSNIAPKMVAQFKALANEGVYNGVAFHRINPNVIQSGDPNTKDDDPKNDGQGGSEKPDVPAEFSDIPFDTAILGAARGQGFDSANSQFFIMLKRVENFDKRYTVFGKVVDGMTFVRTIGGAQRNGERPLDDIKIKTIKIESKSE